MKAKFQFLFFLFMATQILMAQHINNPDPERFKQEINQFKAWDEKNTFSKNAVLFVGSSSIRLWKTAVAFPQLPVVNRGFGGSHISDVN